MDITPEVIEAVRILRTRVQSGSRPVSADELKRAVDTLDNAGLFEAVDQESDHDIDGSDAVTRPLQVGDRIRHRTVRDADGWGVSGTVDREDPHRRWVVRWDTGDQSLEPDTNEGKDWDKIA